MELMVASVCFSKGGRGKTSFKCGVKRRGKALVVAPTLISNGANIFQEGCKCP